MKISNQKALQLLEELPLEKVSNEANFLAPLHVKGRMASVVCDDPKFGQRLIAGELGTDDVFWEYEMDQKTGKLRVTGTVNDSATPIKGIQ